MKFPHAVFKAALLLLFVAVLLTGGALAVRGQSALDGFDPNANGIVQIVVVQPDGKILIGGDFTIVQGISRNRIARLNPDGTLDQLFDPNANGYVNTFAVQADGKILVGGSFSGLNSIGGQTRNYIARLDGVTGQADSFNPNADSSPYSIVVQADGKILVGGSFTSIGGQTRNRMARLDATTGLADSFNPAVSGLAVNTIVVQADGRILVGGTFGSIGGQTRSHIARIDTATGLADSFNPNASQGFYVITAIAVQADGKVLAGGTFTTIGGQTRNSIARLDATTGLADSFNPSADNIVRSIAVQTDGKILVGGDFSNIGGQTRNSITRLEAVTGAADSFNPNPSAPSHVNCVALQADGKILAGGSFSTLTPNGGTAVTRNNIARLETDGRLDRTVNLGLTNSNVNGYTYIYTFVVQPDGKFLIGGGFTTVLGVTRNNIARLNSDGTLDTAFNPNANESIVSISLQADGKILVGGDFTSIGGQTRNRIARLDATTGLADSFNPNASGRVGAIVVQVDGKILVGGGFTNIAGQTRNRIARLDPASGAVDSFNPNASDTVNSIAVQSDGKILVGGDFEANNQVTISIGGQTRNGMARLDSATGLADSFNPNFNHHVHTILRQPDNTMLVGGYFSTIGGVFRIHCARLDATTGLADSFNPAPQDGSVYSIAVQSDSKILIAGTFKNYGTGTTRTNLARLDAATAAADSFDPNANSGYFAMGMQSDGKILVGGTFSSIGGQSRNGFARLNNNTPAQQNLAVTQSTLIWTRGGSSPRLTRATFEISTNNVSYNFLGHGTADGAHWTLTDLNLPTGQNIYIRARGYYRSGYQNGSESITESVRNAFIVAQPLLNIQRSANTNVVLSWATNFAGFTLESKTNLNTNVWSVVTNAPAVSGTNNVVTNAIGGSARFYRLRQ
ncbi:MAG: delta-60 repeat domain-containing protein [Verrucomicrobiota bacterium]